MDEQEMYIDVKPVYDNIDFCVVVFLLSFKNEQP